MNLPNALTVSRIAFAVILVVLLERNSLITNIMAAVIFAAASLTDFYDGHLAKRKGLVSDFGKIMDPIADKVLMLAAFAVFAHMGMMAWWMVIAIALREALVTADRLAAMRHGSVLAAEKAGKIKTVAQIIAVALVLLYLIAGQSAACASWFYGAQKAWQNLIHAAMVAVVFITVGSGAMYFNSKWKIEN